MRRWHPPVPAGKLYSGPALDIGPALAMLLWCYDGIQRDGTVEVAVEEAALEIGKPYRTVKDWWRQLREGPFFSEKKDRGHLGWRVRFADEWIDWRILEHNYPEGRKFALEVEEGGQKELTQVPLKSRSSPDEGRNSALNGHAYKVLNTTDQTRESEDQDRTRHALSHPAMAAYYAAFPHVRLNQKQEAIISELVGEGVERLECWREVIQDYELSPNWKPENIGNMRSRFDRKWEERRQKKPADTRPPLPVVKPATDRPDSQAAARALVEMRKAHNERTPDQH